MVLPKSSAQAARRGSPSLISLEAARVTANPKAGSIVSAGHVIANHNANHAYEGPFYDTIVENEVVLRICWLFRRAARVGMVM